MGAPFRGLLWGATSALIGSTANIVALGMLEKQAHSSIGFFQWLNIGTLSAIIACLIAWGMLTLMAPYMPG